MPAGRLVVADDGGPARRALLRPRAGPRRHAAVALDGPVLGRGARRARDPRRGGAVDRLGHRHVLSTIRPMRRRLLAPLAVIAALVAPPSAERRRDRRDGAERGPAGPAPGRADAPLRVRADRHRAGPEHDRVRGQRAQARRAGLDRRLQARPRLRRRRHRPARGRHPPPPRRLAVQLRAAVRGRRGEDDRQRAGGLRLALRARGPLDHEPHDPQPDAEPDAGVHHLRPRLHPGRRARGRRDPRRCTRRGST